MRVLVGVIGMAGHALPALALAAELRARGHEVRLHSYERWQAAAENLGIQFRGAEREIATGIETSEPGAQAGLADTARALVASIDEFEPQIVISDGLTLSPALAAEVRSVPRAILFPEVYPVHAPGLPPFSLGLMAPRTKPGRAAWRGLAPLLATRLPSTAWLRDARARLNRERAVLGLSEMESFDRGSDAGLTLVATLPQLEYPRSWPAGTHVIGPMFFDRPHPDVELPAGDEPLIVVAPSTVKDPQGRLVSTVLAALADEPVRLVASTSGGALPSTAVPANAVVADWIDYEQLFCGAALVICHGNHGTVVRALHEGVPVLVSPAMPDDAEHGARLAWSGAGSMIPKPLLGRASLRAAVRAILAERRFAARAEIIAAWSRGHDGPSRGADLVERHAADAGD